MEYRFITICAYCVILENTSGAKTHNKKRKRTFQLYSKCYHCIVLVLKAQGKIKYVKKYMNN